MAILAVLVSHQPSYMAMASIPPPLLCHSSQWGGRRTLSLPASHSLDKDSKQHGFSFSNISSSITVRIQFISLALISRVLEQVSVKEVLLRAIWEMFHYNTLNSFYIYNRLVTWGLVTASLALLPLGRTFCLGAPQLVRGWTFCLLIWFLIPMFWEPPCTTKFSWYLPTHSTW